MTNFAKIFLVMVSVFVCQQAEASTAKQVIGNANDRFGKLASIFQSNGYEKAIGSINTGKESKYQNAPLGDLVAGGLESGGHIVCVEESKVVVSSSDPSELNKDVSKDPLVLAIIAALKTSSDEKVVVSYNNGKSTAVAWGRKALMGEALNKTMHMKFFCYVAFDNPGS